MNNNIRILLPFLVIGLLFGCGGSGGSTPDGDTDAPDQEETLDQEEAVQCISGVAARPLPVAADETFDLGPYLMQPKPDSIVVMWRTLEAADGLVEYGLDEALGSSTGHQDSLLIHEVTLTGLTPDTRYFYRVASAGVTSAMHHFHTAPEAGQPFRIAAWGDNQNGPDVFATVLQGIAGAHPYFLLGVGDHVQDGKDAELWKTQLFGPARALFHEVAFYAAIGNHEKNASHLYDLYSYPHTDDIDNHESFYSFTYGNAFFLVINTNLIFFPVVDYETEISTWLREQVASPEAQNATWRIALAHEPGYAEAWGDGSCTYEGYLPVREFLMPLLEEHHFHAYLSGHTHGYERGMTGGGMAYFVTGGGGGGLDAWCLDWPTTTVAHYEHHFLSMEFGCDQLAIEALYPDGARFDWLTLSRSDYGQIVDQGPVADLPPPVINSDSPTLQDR